jgi:L-ascorbate metabolism protein UlaG (beta-lactamase superfamily)
MWRVDLHCLESIHANIPCRNFTSDIDGRRYADARPFQSCGGLYMLGNRLSTRACVLVLFCVATTQAVAASAQTELTWYGQSAFKLVTPAGHVILFDPWFANPMNKEGKATGDALKSVDLILVSHGHFDHVGQAADISRRTGAKLVTTLDLGEALGRYGGFPQENMSYQTLGNAGGILTFFDGEVRILLVPAVHSSHVSGKDLGVSTDEETHWGGSPSGFVVAVRNGPTIYHTGDTDVFSDMARVVQWGRIDLMLTCIGDHFTMGPERAAEAVALVKPVRAVPMHYGTFLPMMTGTPEAFQSALAARGMAGVYAPMIVGVPVRY